MWLFGRDKIPGDIERLLGAADEMERARGYTKLWDLVKKNTAVRPRAAVAFREWLARETAPWPRSTCLRGIEELEGQDHTAPLWLAEFTSDDDARSRQVAYFMAHPRYFPALEERLWRSRNESLRYAILHAFGQSKDHAALPILLQAMADPALRPAAIESLGCLGFTAAIPHIEPYLEDHTHCWQEDNHGPMLRVSDIASRNIGKLQMASRIR